MEGIIHKALSGFYYVDCGGESVTCRARGKFRHEKFTPLVGDRVSVSLLPDGAGTIDAVLPRKNEFHRPAVANIDTLVIICSGAIPVTDPFLIDRVVAMAERRKCESVICFNKWDLEQPQTLYETYRDAGFPTLRVSAETGEGIQALSDLIAGKVCAFTGNSGVGKSSILNRLEPDVVRPVGQVSEKLGRGRHTTRHVELYPLPGGGYAADTPGFSTFDLERYRLTDKEQLVRGFREIERFSKDCRFTSCSHTCEKGCAVLKAANEGKIAGSRIENYGAMYQEIKGVKKWEQKSKHV